MKHKFDSEGETDSINVLYGGVKGKVYLDSLRKFFLGNVPNSARQ